ncbi:hypothetical protein AB0D34_43750 [Streptomyces sp. NPDC048420]|uniref:hypothetical protein n=1 Tax=Streptomyces sp. NPDC048420 TaxID=3155755 RepID=UPI0034197BEE
MTAAMTTMTTTAGPAEDGGTRLFGPRGRHRKPRPRKVLLAAGGLALAAGALSLVRLAPDAGLGGYGATEPDPQAAPGTDSDLGIATGTDRATNAAATVGSIPQPSPSSTTAMGGISATATPAPGTSPAPTGSATAVPLPFAAAPTTIPQAPNTQAPAPAPTPTTTPRSPTTTAAPQPSRTTPPAAPAPTPQPTHTTEPAPGLCVPIIGLCVQQRG